jgi:hypothetical protein
MAGLETISTEILRSHLNVALIQLLPVFGVSEDEFLEFPVPNVRRDIDDLNEMHSKKCPAYHPVYNFFYFPLKNEFDSDLVDIFGWSTVVHEMSHYIHSQINPVLKLSTKTFVKTGKHIPGVEDLEELVANYPCFILKLYTSAQITSSWYLYRHEEIYDKHGPLFVRKLAMMNLEQAKSEGLIRL